MKFIIGRKLQMTQAFHTDGSVVPVTLVRALPCTVSQVKTVDRDGYIAVQIGGEVTTKHLNKSEAGHLEDLPQASVLREFRVGETDMKRGDEIRVDAFTVGDRVNVVGTSKGRGFQGVVKRHGFHGSPASHGHKDQLRMPGSIGSKRQGPVAPGKRMAGHMGAARVTVQNLEIVSVDQATHTLAVKGALPGAPGSLLFISSHEGKTVWHA